MVRSGLQQDVINMYRRGLRMVYSKPKDVRPAFQLQLRYNFHNPPLGPRDYTAIEHQLRRMDRTLEMMEDRSVQRINTTSAMEEWWSQHLEESRSRRNQDSSSSAPSLSPLEAQKQRRGEATGRGSSEGGTGGGGGTGGVDITKKGDSEYSGEQWGGTLPGRGGT